MTAFPVEGIEVWPLAGLAASERARARVRAHAEAGGVLAYPTGTVYGLGGLATRTGIDSLAALKARAPEKPFLLVSTRSGAFEGLEWTPEARALASYAWPGPMTLVLGDPDGHFDPALRGPGGGVAVRQSPSFAVRVVEGATGGPLTSTSANPPGSQPARDGSGVLDALEGLAASSAMVVEGGSLAPSTPSTLVDCTVSPPRVLREGPSRPEDIAAVAAGEPRPPMEAPPALSILFVCTGNTCRSPMAAALARAAVRARGWPVHVASAGVYAAPGAPATMEAVDAVKDLRGQTPDLAAHRSQPLTPELVARSDLILTMGPGHLEGAFQLGAGGKATMLSAFSSGEVDPFQGAGIPDPIGHGPAVYQETARVLADLVEEALGRVAPFLDPVAP